MVQLMKDYEDVHDELVINAHKSEVDLNAMYNVSFLVLMMPLNVMCKYVFTKLSQ